MESFLNVRCPRWASSCAHSWQAHEAISGVRAPFGSSGLQSLSGIALIRLDKEEENSPKIDGLESVVLNDFVASRRLEVRDCLEVAAFGSHQSLGIQCLCDFTSQACG